MHDDGVQWFFTFVTFDYDDNLLGFKRTWYGMPDETHYELGFFFFTLRLTRVAQ